jgi:hypothetical protein
MEIQTNLTSVSSLFNVSNPASWSIINNQRFQTILATVKQISGTHQRQPPRRSCTRLPLQ